MFVPGMKVRVAPLPSVGRFSSDVGTVLSVRVARDDRRFGKDFCVPTACAYPVTPTLDRASTSLSQLVGDLSRATRLGGEARTVEARRVAAVLRTLASDLEAWDGGAS